MSEEEINKKIDYFNQHEINVSDEESEKILREAEKVINGIIDLYHELKEENASLQKEIEALELIHETYKEVIEDIENRYISKDKIREKIKELENLYKDKYFHLDYVKEILQELLEE